MALAPAAWLLVLVAIAFALGGCGLVERVTGETARKQQRSEATKQANQALQQKVMRFADQYVERVGSALETMLRRAGDDSLQVEVLAWQLGDATAAFQVAAGPSPATSAIDMVVLVSLNRRIVEARWTGRYGDAARPAQAVYRALEAEAWRLLEGAATAEQIADFSGFLDGWFEDHPEVESAAFIRFTDLVRVGDAQQAGRAPKSLLGLVGLDPLAGIDPAVREVEQTRMLAERSVYYAQRVPMLIDIQLRLMAARLAATQESRELFGTVGELGQLSSSLTRLSDEAPALIAREREAAIAQFMAELQLREQEMARLAQELRAALEAGTVTSAALEELVLATDRLVARFDRGPAPAPSGVPTRPFDINEYTRLVVELAATARELQSVVTGIEAATPTLAGQVDDLSARLQALVDQVFWRLLVLILAVLAAAVAFLWVRRRIVRMERAS